MWTQALMFCRAKNMARCACDGVSQRQVEATMSAGDHGLWVFESRPRSGVRSCRNHSPALAAPDAEGNDYNQQNEQVFHATRSSSTSITKREPT